MLSKYRKAENNDDLFPITHWIMMGLNEYGILDSGDQNYTNSFKSYEQKIDANISEIKNRIAQKGFIGMVKHIYGKQVINWSEGAAQFITRTTMNNKYGTAYRYISGDRVDFLILYSQSYRAAVLMLTLISLFGLFFKKNTGLLFLLVLTLFGGMLFYLLWEAKRCYSVPFMFLILILAVHSTELSGGKAERFMINNRKKIFALNLCIVAAVIGLFALKEEKYTETLCTAKRISVLSTYTRILEPYTDFNGINQSFYTENPFNRVILVVSKSDEVSGGSYLITIKNSKGDILMKRKFSEKNIKEGSSNDNLRFGFEDIIPNGKEKYVISIKPLNENKSITFYRENGVEADLYNGEFNCDGERNKNDLVMNVYHLTTEPYMPDWSYIVIFLLVTIPYSIAITVNLLRRKKAFAIDNAKV